MRHWLLRISCCLLILFLSVPSIFAQLGKITIDLKKDKPTKYKTRTLKSEKTGQKKFTLPRKIMQNTVSHYNYYFNANNKIHEVIERARLSNKEAYDKLLPFYSYSLSNTATQATQLDSVIYKATAGILLHDLRSEWVDNFYLLIGKAYLLKQNYDSAAMTFQFINYNLYPRKKKDDDQLIVGSNSNGSNNTISIANKENRSFTDKILSRPPSRNDALVWQVRALIEMNEFSDAAGLINTLHNDNNFPARLKPALEEVNAYWFYKQGIYDSTTIHLENALANADDLQEKARWEYLLAQLYERSKKYEKASESYNKAISHTTDPLLDIYANLYNAMMYDSSGGSRVDNSIARLVHMAKRDKFEPYRNIIYYSAGELALQKPDTVEAEFFIRKGLTYETTDISFKNKSFLKLADINYIRKNYKQAFNYYDSLQAGDTSLVGFDKIEERKAGLYKIVHQLNIIEREDSLQKIALMSTADREAFVKKLAKKLKKESGVKDEEETSVNPATSAFESRNVSSDIFSSNNTKGDWYFYNAAVKSKGYSEFVRKWGKRSNVDNWRITSADESGNVNVSNQPQKNAIKPKQGIDRSGDVDDVAPETDYGKTPDETNAPADISFTGLMKNIPDTPEKLQALDSVLSRAMFELAKLLQNELEDYSGAISEYEKSLQRYPENLYDGELYMNLAYCYQKLGDMAKAKYYNNLVTSKFASSPFAEMIRNPKANLSAEKNPEVTKKYEAIYNLFIEGQFEKAIAQKKAADSLYANNYWTPQLLYIESVFYVKQKQDSLAIEVLNNIITSYPKSPLKDKAEIMIDVLKRRSEIETYLTNLTIERLKDDTTIVVDEPLPPPVRQIRDDNNLLIKKDSIATKKMDTLVTANKITKTTPPIVMNAAFNFVANAPQFVVMLLDKVDPVYISEARNAFVRYNRERAGTKNIEIIKEILDKDKNLLVFHEFADAPTATAYADKIKKDALSEISWLPANKYSFLIISDPNLQLLKVNKDLQGYIKVLRNAMPGKF